jgi:hypothetical protein
MSCNNDSVIKRITLVVMCLSIFACGSTPTEMGEKVRGVIDRTEDQRPDSDDKVIYKDS